MYFDPLPLPLPSALPASTARVILCIRRSVISMQIPLASVTLSCRVIDFLGLGSIVASPAGASLMLHLPLGVALEMKQKAGIYKIRSVCTCVCSSEGPHTQIVMDAAGYWFKHDNKLILIKA